MGMYAETMYTFVCDVCGYESSPRFSAETPHNWEQERIGRKIVLLCPSHIYGLSKHEIEKLERV